MYLIEIKDAEGNTKGYWKQGRIGGMSPEPDRVATVVEATRYETRARAAETAALLLWAEGSPAASVGETIFVGLMEI